MGSSRPPNCNSFRSDDDERNAELRAHAALVRGEGIPLHLVPDAVRAANIAHGLGLCDEELDVVLAGGIHVHGEGPFRNGFSEAVLASVPGARFAVLDAPPVVGAALLALEAAGEATEGVGAQLAEDLRRRVGS